MHHSCVFRNRGWHSFSFEDRPYWSNERHPFVRSSRACCRCCNSMCRVPVNPVYCYRVYGMKQSSLIQWSPCRKLVLGSSDPCFHALVSAYDVDRSCCDKVCCFRDKSESVRKERLRKFRVLEERTERCTDEFIDESEVLLSLLTDDIDEEYLHVTREVRRVAKKNIVNEIQNINVLNKGRSKKKRFDSGVLEHESACESESQHISELENDTGKEKIHRTQEKQAFLQEKHRRGILKETHNRALLTSGIACEKEEREVSLTKVSRMNEEKRDEETKSVMGSLKARTETEKREDVRKKVNNDGSSCSSYHSFSSSGDYESDTEIEHRQVEYLNSSTGHERNSRSSEIVREQEMHEDHREEHGISMTKKNSGKEYIVGSNFVESDFRKKSEKKLTDASVEEVESRKKASQKESKFLMEHKHYEKSSDYNVSYDDKKKNSSWGMKLDDEKKQQYKQASDGISTDSETRLKYKNHVDIENSYGSKENIYHVKGDVSPKIATSSHVPVGKSQSAVGITTRNELNQSSIQMAEVSRIQEVDVKKKSISHQSFKTANRVDNYTISLTSENDDKKLQPQFEQVTGMVVSGGVSQPGEIENKSVLEQSNQMIKQKENISLSHGFAVEAEKHPEGGQDKITKPDHSVVGSDDVAKISITRSSAENVHNTVDIKETRASTVEVLLEGQHFQSNVVPFASGDFPKKQHHSKDDDWFSRAEGPSDEMWKLYEPSTDRQQEEVIQEDETKAGTEIVKGYDETKAGSEIVKRTGRSLWNVIGDILRLRWSPRSGSHHSHSSRRTGGRSPQTQSTGSEPWFSSHEAEENEEASRGKGRSTVQGSSYSHRKGRLHFQVEEKSISSTSEGHVKLDGLQATTISPAITTSSSSGEEISGRTSGVTPSVEVNDSSTTSPVLQPQEPLVIQGGLRTEQASPSNDGTWKLNTGSMEQSESTVSEGQLKRGMLQRKDQFQRDRFAEWEEAFRLEAEQRKIDETFMREALLEAQKAADNWEVPVGAVLVHDGKIIARGCNLVEELRDSTAHAEMICIRQASNILRTWRLSETVLYVTLEPCPMCAGAILQARIDTVVWGAPNKLLGADGSWIRLFPNGDGGGNGMEQSGKPAAPIHPFHPNIKIRRGVLASECADAMQQFFKLRRKKKDVVKPDPPPQTSCLPVQSRPSKFLSKMHHAFTILFW